MRGYSNDGHGRIQVSDPNGRLNPVRVQEIEVQDDEIESLFLSNSSRNKLDRGITIALQLDFRDMPFQETTREPLLVGTILDEEDAPVRTQTASRPKIGLASRVLIPDLSRLLNVFVIPQRKILKQLAELNR